MSPTGTVQKRRFLKEPSPSTSRLASIVKTVVKQEIDSPSESDIEFDDFADYQDDEEDDDQIETKKRRAKKAVTSDEDSDEDFDLTDSDDELRDFVVRQEIDKPIGKKKRRKKIYTADSGEDNEQDFNPADSEHEREDFVDIVYQEVEEYVPIDKRRKRERKKIVTSDSNDDDEDFNPEKFKSKPTKRKPAVPKGNARKMKVLAVPTDSNEDNDEDFNPAKSKSESELTKRNRGRMPKGRPKKAKATSGSSDGNDVAYSEAGKGDRGTGPKGKVTAFIAQLPEPHRENLTCPKCLVPKPFKSEFSLYQHFLLGHRGDNDGSDYESGEKKRGKRRGKKVVVFMAQLPEPHRENLTCPKCPEPTPFKSEFSLYQHFTLGHRKDNDGADSEARKKKRSTGHMGTVAAFIAQLPESHRENLTCPKCPESKQYKSNRSLYKHFALIHAGGRKLECEFCQRAFSKESTLNDHIQERHSGIRHPCPYCEKVFATELVLNIHIRTHTGEGLLSCPVCGKQFPAKNRLEKHLTIHNTFSKESCVQCEVCGKEMRDKFRLDQHKARVHSEPEYECEICEKRFVQKFELRRHMDSHKQTCDWKCPFCPKRCKARDYILRHIRRLHDMTSEQAREACDKLNGKEGGEAPDDSD